MNFNYPLRSIFKSDIAKITKNLLPNDFTTADERTIRVASDVVISILDEMGIASAKAQDLQNPTTSWAELKDSDHTVYLLLDREEDIDGNGSVIGFLKIGWKKLNVTDLEGECHERNALCVLDFYVHESRQRSGWGKKLFEHMLKEENVSPETLAIDRPSHKFLLFLQKHYGLSDVVPQSNDFVVFTGFFSKADRDFNDSVTNVPKEQLAAGFSKSDYREKRPQSKWFHHIGLGVYRSIQIKQLLLRAGPFHQMGHVHAPEVNGTTSMGLAGTRLIRENLRWGR